MNKPIKFPLAKLLKEKEFLIGLEEGRFKTDSGIMLFNPSYYKDKLKDKYLSEDCYLQPTISDVIMWLYEKHGIWVNIGFSGDESCYLMVTNKIGEIKWNEKGFKSPTEAYETAIFYVLSKLI